eukprot:SAG25_NODE_14284_length_256_cov_4.815287_1_plen_27_part_10
MVAIGTSQIDIACLDGCWLLLFLNIHS